MTLWWTHRTIICDLLMDTHHYHMWHLDKHTSPSSVTPDGHTSSSSVIFWWTYITIICGPMMDTHHHHLWHPDGYISLSSVTSWWTYITLICDTPLDMSPSVASWWAVKITFFDILMDTHQHCLWYHDRYISPSSWTSWWTNYHMWIFQLMMYHTIYTIIYL